MFLVFFHLTTTDSQHNSNSYFTEISLQIHFFNSKQKSDKNYDKRDKLIITNGKLWRQFCRVLKRASSTIHT